MKQRASLRHEVETEEQIQQVGAVKSVAAPRMEASRGFTPLTFDYSHIYADLRRILFFVLFFTAVLVALSFVIK
jgi:hypothetical protein